MKGFMFLRFKTLGIKLAVMTTLESGIDVGPTVINLVFFSRPYSLIRDYIKVI